MTTLAWQWRHLVCGTNLATCTQPRVTQERVRGSGSGREREHEWERKNSRERESSCWVAFCSAVFRCCLCSFCGARLLFHLPFSLCDVCALFFFFFGLLLLFKLIKSVWQNNKRWPCFCHTTHRPQIHTDTESAHTCTHAACIVTHRAHTQHTVKAHTRHTHAVLTHAHTTSNCLFVLFVSFTLWRVHMAMFFLLSLVAFPLMSRGSPAVPLAPISRQHKTLTGCNNKRRQLCHVTFSRVHALFVQQQQEKQQQIGGVQQ